MMRCIKGECGNAGAGQGIGRAYAHALGEAGAAVAVVDIQEEKAKEVAEELSRKGVRSIAIKADVTSAKECDRYHNLPSGVPDSGEDKVYLLINKSGLQPAS